MSFPYRFTETNAILTTEGGQSYSVVLYCQRQLSDCPKLFDGQVYWGQMGKKAMLDSSLRPDGRHKGSYTVFSPRKIGVDRPTPVSRMH
jgi:hypothetical protein